MISAHHRGYIKPKEGSPKEVCYCLQCTVQSQFATKKYKPVALKVKPVMGTLPDKFRIERKILGDPLAEMPKLNPLIGTLGVAVHTSGTVDETVGLNCDLKRLEVKPQTTKQHQQHALVVF